MRGVPPTIASKGQKGVLAEEGLRYTQSTIRPKTSNVRSQSFVDKTRDGNRGIGAIQTPRLYWATLVSTISGQMLMPLVYPRVLKGRQP